MSEIPTLSDDEAGRWWWDATAIAGQWSDRTDSAWRRMPQEMKDVFIQYGVTALRLLRDRTRGTSP